MLWGRVCDHAEAAGTHAEGRFGFRRQRSTEQAILALRTLMERHRLQRRPGSGSRRQGSQRGTQLWPCFVDFRQAYDRVPRQQLWHKPERLGYSGAWLRAVQALYADVPMSVSVPGVQGRVFQATQGLKQGCPLSPTLFSLYIDDFEQRMLTADSGGAGYDLPALVEGYPAPLCCMLTIWPAAFKRSLVGPRSLLPGERPHRQHHQDQSIAAFWSLL
jgi:hypothetical protein